MIILLIYILFNKSLCECIIKKPKPPYELNSLILPNPYLFNSTTFSYITNNKKIELFFFIPISPCSIKTREVIRDTWINKLKCYNYEYKFFMGKDYVNKNVLFDEYKRYNDIVQFQFLNNYLNLTLLTLLSLQWINNHYINVKYIIKCDKDMFPNIDRIRKRIYLFPNYRIPFIAGYKTKKQKIIRNIYSKNYIPYKIYNKSFLQSYVYGGFMIYSQKAVILICEKDLPILPIIYREDMYIGLLAYHYRMKIIDLKDEYNIFNYGINCDIYKKKLCLHGYSYKNISIFWNKCNEKMNLINNIKYYDVYYIIVFFEVFFYLLLLIKFK